MPNMGGGIEIRLQRVMGKDEWATLAVGPKDRGNGWAVDFTVPTNAGQTQLCQTMLATNYTQLIREIQELIRVFGGFIVYSH